MQHITKKSQISDPLLELPPIAYIVCTFLGALGSLYGKILKNALSRLNKFAYTQKDIVAN